MTQAAFTEQTPKSFLQNLFDESSTQKQRLGCVMRLADGREFVYVKNGATNLAVGVLCTTPAPLANKSNLAANAILANANSILLANVGAPGVTANDYADGFIHFNKGTGLGYAYKIKSHPVAVANANLTITLYDPVRLAVANGANYTLVMNPHRGVVIGAATVAGDNPLVGATVIPLTANYYGWVQTRGPVALLVNGTLVLGTGVIQAANGAVGVATANDIVDVIGRALIVNATTEYALIDLRM